MFFLIGFSISAQELIVLRNGNMIEARVLEISPTEIRYKHFDHLDGPTIVILAADVLSIRYENGRIETINAISATEQRNTQTVNTAIDQDRFIFGINANAGGALNYVWGGASGASVNIELGKGNFNSEINLMFPIGGFGFLATFNGFWHTNIGGFYLGGGIGYSFFDVVDPLWPHERANRIRTIHSLPVGLNIGYKFVTSSGMYFRTGIFSGFDFGYIWTSSRFNVLPAYIKPDLAIGWTMR